MAICLGVYCLFAVLIYWPTSPLSSQALPSGGFGDPAQMTWFLAWIPYALAHGQNPFHTTLIDYPFGVDLADNTSVPLLGLLVTPMTRIFGAVASFNFLLRASFVASAGAMFFVLRRYCRSLVACFVGGLCYGFGPFLASQGQGNAHLNLVFLPIPPLLFWCVDEICLTQRRKAIPMGFLLGALCSAQILIAPEVLSDCAVIGAVALLGLCVINRSEIRRRFAHAERALWVGGTTFVVLAGYPIWEMLAGSGHVTGPVQPAANLQGFASDLFTPLIPTARQFLAPKVLVGFASHFATHNASALGGYLGAPFLVFVVVLGAIWHRERIVRIAEALALLAFVLSLGSHLHVDGHNTSIPLPEGLFVHVPVLDNTTPARFALEVLLFVSIVMAVCIDRTISHLAEKGPSRSRITKASALGACSAFALIALAPNVPFRSTSLPWSSSLVTTLKRAIPTNSVTLTYPFASPPYVPAMVWQATDEMSFTITGGYATVQGSNDAGQFFPKLVNPPFVEEYLSFEKAGRRGHYPLPPAAANNGVAALCRYTSRYDVSSLVIWMGATNASRVDAYFRSAFGSPSVATGQVQVWTHLDVHTAQGCH
jgi:hypothetical protein